MTGYSFPLARDEFMDRLKVNRVVFDLPDQSVYSGLGSGGLIGSEVRPRLWVGEIGLTDKAWAEADRIGALLRLLRSPGASFHVYDVRHMWPAFDPGGVAVAAAAPQIMMIHDDQDRLVISGLPAGYQLRAGDRFCFDYQDAAGTTLTALHEVVTWDVIADGVGQTPIFQVEPHIRPGAVVGTSVEFVKPYCKAVIDPSSVAPGEGRKMETRGMSFRFTQQLR